MEALKAAAEEKKKGTERAVKAVVTGAKEGVKGDGKGGKGWWPF